MKFVRRTCTFKTRTPTSYDSFYRGNSQKSNTVNSCCVCLSTLISPSSFLFSSGKVNLLILHSQSQRTLDSTNGYNIFIAIYKLELLVNFQYTEVVYTYRGKQRQKKESEGRRVRKNGKEERERRRENILSLNSCL